MPGNGGVRVALIAGIAAAKAAEKSAADAAAKEPARPGVVEIGPESRIILEYQDDNLTVFYLLEVVNNARTPIDIGGPLLIQLPTGAAGASMMQGSSPQRQRAWRHADYYRTVRAGQDDRAGRLLAAASGAVADHRAEMAGRRWRRCSSASRRSATCRCRRRSSPTRAR